MTIHPKLIEAVAKVIWETRNYSTNGKAVAVIEFLIPLMEQIADDEEYQEPASLVVARHLAADPEVKP